jgi:hypothetical protein
MRGLSACHVVWAPQGGCCMFPLPTSSGQDRSALAHVWAQLSSDRQLRVIALVADLALRVLVTRSQNEPAGEEVGHVDTATDPQNLS